MVVATHLAMRSSSSRKKRNFKEMIQLRLDKSEESLLLKFFLLTRNAVVLFSLFLTSYYNFAFTESAISSCRSFQ